MGADVCLLLTDVDGVFDKPPGSNGAKKIDVFMQDTDFVAGGVKRKLHHTQMHTIAMSYLNICEIITTMRTAAGSKSERGRGGIDAKVCQ